jgi:hypothetical protein
MINSFLKPAANLVKSLKEAVDPPYEERAQDASSPDQVKLQRLDKTLSELEREASELPVTAPSSPQSTQSTQSPSSSSPSPSVPVSFAHELTTTKPQTDEEREAVLAYDAELPMTKANKRGPYDKKRNQLVVGMRFGNLILRRKIPEKKADQGLKPALRQKWRCECICGTFIDVPRYYLLRRPNPKTHCGCQSGSLRSKFNREYRIWQMIRQRTRNPEHVAYEHYHSRGIDIFDDWYTLETGFELFLDHIGPAPSIYHSCDRIHNSRGYVPGNVKWSTATEQRANQGDRIGGKTAGEIEEMGYTVDEWIELVRGVK